MTIFGICGDSNTAEDRENWPDVALPLLGNPTVYNVAWPGASYGTRDNEIPERKFQYQVSQLLGQTATFTDFVIALGTNDLGSNVPPVTTLIPLGTAAAALAKNYEDLDPHIACDSARRGIHLLRYNSPEANIHVLLPPQRGDVSAGWLASLGAFSGEIEKIARHYSCQVIDLFHEAGIVGAFETVAAGMPNTLDGLHLNAAGRERVGRYVAARINSFWGPSC